MYHYVFYVRCQTPSTWYRLSLHSAYDAYSLPHEIVSASYIAMRFSHSSSLEWTPSIYALRAFSLLPMLQLYPSANLLSSYRVLNAFVCSHRKDESYPIGAIPGDYNNANTLSVVPSYVSFIGPRLITQ